MTEGEKEPVDTPGEPEPRPPLAPPVPPALQANFSRPPLSPKQPKQTKPTFLRAASTSALERRRAIQERLVRFSWLQALQKKLDNSPLKTLMAVDVIGVICIFATAILIYLNGPQFGSFLVYTTYPMWRTLLAARSDNADEKRAWLQFWIMYYVFTLFYAFVDFTPLSKAIPHYELLKFVSFIYLYSPQRTINGASKLMRSKSIREMLDSVLPYEDQLKSHTAYKRGLKEGLRMVGQSTLPGDTPELAVDLGKQD